LLSLPTGSLPAGRAGRSGPRALHGLQKGAARFKKGTVGRIKARKISAMPDTPDNAPLPKATLPLRVADLPPRRPTRFHLRPDADARADIAAELDMLALRKLDFAGEVIPEGRRDWRLEGRLGATVVQACVVTAEPVVTRIETEVMRRFLHDMPDPGEPEVEMPEDDSVEKLGKVIDPGAVMQEALALALPDYPRKPGAELPQSDFPPPGAEPLDESRPNPFAALAKLKPKDDGDA
jgi:uncharacterized metal-binding protein YceD (DUF177 family)